MLGTTGTGYSTHRGLDLESTCFVLGGSIRKRPTQSKRTTPFQGYAVSSDMQALSNSFLGGWAEVG